MKDKLLIFVLCLLGFGVVFVPLYLVYGVGFNPILAKGQKAVPAISGIDSQSDDWTSTVNAPQHTQESFFPVDTVNGSENSSVVTEEIPEIAANVLEDDRSVVSIESDGNVEVLECHTVSGEEFDYLQYVLVIQNTSSTVIDVLCDGYLLNSDGNPVSEADDKLNAMPPGRTGCLILSFEDVQGNKVDYKITCIDASMLPVTAIDLSSADDENSIWVTATNNENYPVQSLEVDAMFFKDGELVDTGTAYMSDTVSSELQAGESMTKQIASFSNYDDVKLFWDAYYIGD